MCFALLASACSEDDPKDTEDSGSFWVVGDRGAVLDVTPETEAIEHTTEVTQDLEAITCFGQSQAWYVGAAGRAAYTDDGGAVWQPLDLATGVDLYDVASIDPLRVAIAGEQGTLLLSTDGQQFSAVAGASGTLTAVDLTPDGLVAVSIEGGIWLYQTGSDQALEVDSFGQSLHGIDFGDHTPIGAIVGEDGLLLWTEDAGYTWTQRESGTSHDLHAVQVSMDGNEAIAVGEAGTVVRIAGPTISVQSVDEVDLRAVHLDAWGRGAVVGDGGRVLHTVDAGYEFRAETVSAQHLKGVDALGSVHW